MAWKGGARKTSTPQEDEADEAAQIVERQGLDRTQSHSDTARAVQDVPPSSCPSLISHPSTDAGSWTTA